MLRWDRRRKFLAVDKNLGYGLAVGCYRTVTPNLDSRQFLEKISTGIPVFVA